MIDFDHQEIRPSKHFRNTWMRKWDWDMHDLRTALKEAAIVQVGKHKYEAITKYKAKGKSRKLILMADEMEQVVYLVTGTEGS